jgi:ABC-2 type transport system ATP-binding protein
VTPAIRTEGLTKHYGKVVGIEGLTLEVRPGEVFGFLGPNGAGKTTTIRLLLDLLRPTRGRAEVLGLDVRRDSVEVRRAVGYLPGDLELYERLTGRELLDYFADLRGGVDAALVRRLAERLDLSLGRRIGDLSKGNRQKVGIVQAFMHRPRVLVLDEPTAGLDPRVAYEVRQLIKSRKGRCTLVVSSHNLQELEEICDAACILDRGRVVASGSMSELTASSEEVRFKLAAGPVPIPVVRDLPVVKRLEWDDDKRELTVYFDRGTVDAEAVIGQVLWVLLQNQARISAVSKGRGLEQRVMELTD